MLEDVSTIARLPGADGKRVTETHRLARGWGDTRDLAALAAAFLGGRTEKRPRAAIAIVAGLTAVDLLGAFWTTRAERAERRMIRVRASVTVNRTGAEAYRFWHKLENLPRFMGHLTSVRITGAGRSHWTVRGPAGRPVTWDAEIVDDQPNQLIAWRSLPGARVRNSGVVAFVPAPGGRGTEVRVDLRYDPPAGALGNAAAKLFGAEPGQQVRDDLRRFKQVIETGEVVRSDGTPDGTSVRRQAMQRPARPSASRPLPTTVAG